MSQLTRIATIATAGIAAALFSLTPASAGTPTPQTGDVVDVVTDMVEAAGVGIGDLPTCWEWCTK